MKPLTYTIKTPSRAGMFWYLSSIDAKPKIMRVFKDSMGYWSVQYDTLQIAVDNSWNEDALSDVGVDYIANYRTGFWCEIPQPTMPVHLRRAALRALETY